MVERKRVVATVLIAACGAQVLTAVYKILALGGLESFFFPKVELRFLSSIVSTSEVRIAWVVVNTALALVGLWLLRGRYRSK